MLKKLTLTAAVAAFALAGAATAEAQQRQQIRIVGSSTVYPFAIAVAERFGRTTDFQTPVIESTGSGGGLRLFCAGIGPQHPDITNASRRMKQSEWERCQENGVAEITEVKIGFDGIVLANSVNAEAIALTRRQIWLALAARVPADNEDASNLVENPNEKWSDIDSSLPDSEILVMGPPPTSGTRDAFVELVMEAGCNSFEAIEAMEDENEEEWERVCLTVREDGRWVDAGENDNLIVQRLENEPEAFGVFGFSFLDQNRDTIQGNAVDGVEPTFEAIASGDYPVSRSLFFYVKNVHAGAIPGIREYVREFTAESTWGPNGYLVDEGLIPLPEEVRARQREAARSLTPMSGLN